MAAQEKVGNIQRLTVAMPCVLLHAGRLQEPKPAIVKAASDDGVLDLIVFPDYGGASRLVRGVHHMDDPFNQQNPVHLGTNGCYLSPREFADRQQKSIEEAQRVERERHVAEMRNRNERVVRLAKDGVPVMQIAAQVGIAEGMVEQILRDAKVDIPKAFAGAPAV